MNDAPPPLNVEAKFVVPWVPCVCGGYALWFEKPGLLQRHYLQTHPGRVFKFSCSLCDKCFPGHHAVRCHFSVCRGRVERPRGEFVCGVCSADFATARGLSMHERHRHPALQNVALLHQRPRPLGLFWGVLVLGRRLTLRF